MNPGAVFLEGAMGGGVEEKGVNQNRLDKSYVWSFQVSVELDSAIRSLAKMEWAGLISI